MQDHSKYIQIFITDSRAELEEMNRILLHLEKAQKNPELLNALFRKVHSLKGMSAMMGYQRLNELCHAIEEPLGKIRDGKSKLTRGMIDLLFNGADLLESLVNEVVTDSPPQIDYQSFINRLKDEASSEAIPIQKEKPTIKYQPPRAIPVDTKELDELINTVGEMILRRNRLIELNRPFFSHEIEEEMETLENLINDLYRQVLKIRMVPVSITTDILHRIVRDLATNQGKEIDFKVEGDKEIELDRTILEEMMDPLIHLIRNAVDHGIELPAIRKEQGKPKGKIRLRFSKEKDLVRVEVEDNGQGIDRVKVKEEAIKKGIINKERFDSLKDEDILMLLFTPGFSTSQTVTNVSGRGVGLDVVKEKVEKLGGSIQVYSEHGSDSQFILKIPTTTHIIFALLVKLNSQIFAIPIPKVLGISKVNLKTTQNKFIYQDHEVNLIRLKDLLKIGDASREEITYPPVVVAEIGGKKVGLIVDELVKIDQIFVKPLEKPINKIEGLYGTTILGDGRMVLVLELERLR